MRHGQRTHCYTDTAYARENGPLVDRDMRRRHGDVAAQLLAGMLANADVFSLRAMRHLDSAFKQDMIQCAADMAHDLLLLVGGGIAEEEE